LSEGRHRSMLFGKAGRYNNAFQRTQRRATFSPVHASLAAGFCAAELVRYAPPLRRKDMERRVNYRKLAFAHYPPICAHCGFGVRAVLEVAHLDCNRSNNDLSNLVVLCPNCHKMHDIGLIPTEVVLQMRDGRRAVDWAKRMKDAGVKAALTRKRQAAARKAVETRRRNNGA